MAPVRNSEWRRKHRLSRVHRYLTGNKKPALMSG
nr:MAG TPA: hypothetical protein [Caudoviricetes sp.]